MATVRHDNDPKQASKEILDLNPVKKRVPLIESEKSLKSNPSSSSLISSDNLRKLFSFGRSLSDFEDYSNCIGDPTGFLF